MKPRYAFRNVLRIPCFSARYFDKVEHTFFVKVLKHRTSHAGAPKLFRLLTIVFVINQLFM
jgi:hypothetical protein